MPGVLFQNFLFLHIPVQINGAALTRAITESVPVFSHVIAGPPGNLVSRTLFLILAVKDVPAGCQDHEIAETSKGEAPFVNQLVDLLNLTDVKGGVEAVVRISFPNWLDETLFLILPDTFLGEIHEARDIIDEKEIPHFHLFVFSPGHKTFYKKKSLNDLNPILLQKR